MSEQWRILVVEGDEQVNQSTVNSLRKDGYFVRGVNSGAEAIRVLWTEEYDVIIGDLKMPGTDGMEMLQWLRSYRPRTHMIMVAADASPASRTSALEGGVVGYLQKPLDLHLLKEELRRLLQQTGFSASLDSFDLLDVIQIITMSRKSIALVVNTGPEERGILCFQGGELVWAEYDTLRGEEAFFALAAYKNGTVTQQPWYEQVTPNVTQPLSRLIFQALQYRSKYSEMRSSSEHEALPAIQPAVEEDDDRPFVMLVETQLDPLLQPDGTSTYQHAPGAHGENADDREWWQPTDKISGLPHKQSPHAMQPVTRDGMEAVAAYEEEPGKAESVDGVPSTPRIATASQHSDLPSWLTDLPAKFDMSMKSDVPMLHAPVLSSDGRAGAVPPTKPSPSEWQPLEKAYPSLQSARPLQTLSPARKSWQAATDEEAQKGLNNSASPQTGKLGAPKAIKRNYAALVSALQTIGYSISGFVAAAVVGLDGQPIAQVAIDDLDISPACVHFSRILQGARQSLADGQWGKYEDTVITSSERYILLRIIGNDKEAFQVLITTRDSDPSESLEVMANVEGTIGAALH